MLHYSLFPRLAFASEIAEPSQIEKDFGLGGILSSPVVRWLALTDLL